MSTAAITALVTLGLVFAGAMLGMTISRFQVQDAVTQPNGIYQEHIDDAVKVKRLEDVISKTLDCVDNPGLAIAIVKDGKTILTEGFGVTRPGTNIKVTSKTLFSIASLTKAFTATLMVDAMAKNGSVNLSTTVRNIVGTDFTFNDTQRTEYATVEDLLTHRLRMPSNSDIRFNPQIDRQKFLRNVRYFPSTSPFRVEGSYSSTNYIMAAALTELISGQKWEELMSQTIFGPLSMTSSTFATNVDFGSPNVAPPYSTLGGYKAFINPDFEKQWNSYCGSGCIFSNAEDMTKWMNFHLNEGQKVLPRVDVGDLHSPRSLLPGIDLSKVHKPDFPETLTADLYALGWRVGHYKGYPIVFHTGSTPGYASMLTLVPSHNLGVFVVMNGDDDGYNYRLPLQSYLLDVFMLTQPWLNVSTMCSFPEPWQRRESYPLPVYDVDLKPARDWMDYCGHYTNDGYGDIFIKFNKTGEQLTATYGIGHWQLYPQKTPDEFYGKGLGVTDFWDVNPFIFEAEETTKTLISRLVMKGFSSSTPPLFAKIKNCAF